MTQAVTQTQTTALAMPKGAWGAENTVSDDLILPRLLLVQPTSKMVQKYDASPGQIRSTLDGALLAKKGEKLSFIAFYLFDTWIHSAWKNGKWEFDKIEPRAKNSDFEYEVKDPKTGNPLTKHEKAINAYVMRPEDIKGGLPYVLTFKGAGTFQEGRKFVTLVKKLEILGQPAAARVFSVRTEMRTNEKGTFGVYIIEEGEKTTPEQMGACYQWYQKVRTLGANVKVDTSDLEENSSEDPSGGKF
jgi:hypothetical protein